MTQNKLSDTEWLPAFAEILQILTQRHISLDEGEAIFAYGLGYARGLQQKPIMDLPTITNVHMGWTHGASVETADFTTEEETKS